MDFILPLDPTDDSSSTVTPRCSSYTSAAKQREELESFKNVFYLSPKKNVVQDHDVVKRRDKMLLQEHGHYKAIVKRKKVQIYNRIPICKFENKLFEKIMAEKTENLEELMFRVNIYKTQRANAKKHNKSKDVENSNSYDDVENDIESMQAKTSTSPINKPQHMSSNKQPLQQPSHAPTAPSAARPSSSRPLTLSIPKSNNYITSVSENESVDHNDSDGNQENPLSFSIVDPVTPKSSRSIKNVDIIMKNAPTSPTDAALVVDTHHIADTDVSFVATKKDSGQIRLWLRIFCLFTVVQKMHSSVTIVQEEEARNARILESVIRVQKWLRYMLYFKMATREFEAQSAVEGAQDYRLTADDNNASSANDTNESLNAVTTDTVAAVDGDDNSDNNGVVSTSATGAATSLMRPPPITSKLLYFALRLCRNHPEAKIVYQTRIKSADLLANLLHDLPNMMRVKIKELKR